MSVVLVCGSRSFADPFRAALTIDEVIGKLPDGWEIIHGAARGADQIADEAARRYAHPVRMFPAAWKKHGRGAGIIRNRQMLNESPSLVLAFWDGKSPGTRDTITEARRRGIPVQVIPL